MQIVITCQLCGSSISLTPTNPKYSMNTGGAHEHAMAEGWQRMRSEDYDKEDTIYLCPKHKIDILQIETEDAWS